MEEKTIEAIPAIPLALMLGAINAVIGFFVGTVITIFSVIIMSMIPPGPCPPLIGLFFGVTSIIAMPIIGFIAGFIQGLIFAVVYNFLAPRIGGIKLRFKSESPPSPPP